MTPVLVLLSLASAAVIEQNVAEEVRELLAETRQAEHVATKALKNKKAHAHAHRAHGHAAPHVQSMMSQAESTEKQQNMEDQEKMAEYERTQASQAEMAEQRQQMAKEMQASGAAGMVESPQAIQAEIMNHEQELQPQAQRFGQRAEEDLAKLQNQKVAVTANAQALDYAAKKSVGELKNMEAETVEKPMKRWVDTTATEIAADRKKVHDTASQLKKDFFSTAVTPPASLMEVPSGPGASLVQATTTGLLGSTEDAIARAKAGEQKMAEESKNLEANFEKSFERGMAEGFAKEKKHLAVGADGNLRSSA